MRTKKEIRRDVKDQAEQIMYFEASMPNVGQSEYDDFYFGNGARLLGL